MKVRAYAAYEAGAGLRPYEYEAGPLGPDEVDVRVTHCGICHTDVGAIDNEWDYFSYPLVAGHEVVGVVEAVGEAVDQELLPIGRRVGVGAIAGSCFRCEWCLSGRQNLCPRKDDLVLRGVRGGFAHHVRAGDWRHVQPIPDAIPSAQAAPLLCAGATVFAPLLTHRVRPVDRVAVVGIGGLGHLAVQFLAKWGCEVTAISTTSDKEADARRFGATGFIATREEGALRAAANSFDFVLSTVSADLPWDDYLATLRPGGKLCVVGVPTGPIAVGPLGLLPGAKAVSGAIPGSPAQTRQMFDFAARHGIGAQAEVFPVARADEALDRVRRGQARYRAVLEF
ncbi:putative zinc-type alcohol dehydrogenase-like protein [Saccharothrix coeruleofusca]|uniref:NAD(P)-dependent alcohol dehydrogenase n=1 Tax=Saccharothrix coeruleofusca TaxID=33919 RepID=UPI001AE8C4F5|nr:NAD(P)-dependent alcohol dehydrogenase [Saccharothrix coeruleofusca]MBP2336229.1 putative zinc-type alcohol dehydrogenase-like protein [Saccharothrix coeruleofusca]